MQELVRFLVASMVDHPEDVRVSEVRGDHSLVLELAVHPDDLGRVIGRHGKTAAAIRSVLGAAAAKARMRVVLEILEEEAGRASADRLPADAGDDDGAAGGDEPSPTRPQSP